MLICWSFYLHSLLFKIITYKMYFIQMKNGHWSVYFLSGTHVAIDQIYCMALFSALCIIFFISFWVSVLSDGSTFFKPTYQFLTSKIRLLYHHTYNWPFLPVPIYLITFSTYPIVLHLLVAFIPCFIKHKLPS